MKKWSDYSYGGRTYSMEHLHSMVRTYKLPPSITQPAREYRVRVNFHLHCFTRKPAAGEQFTPRQVIYKNREGRLFCDQRWNASLRLPDVFDRIQHANCHPTEKNNYVTMTVATANGPRDYAVFFKVTSAESDEWDAQVTVISAHQRPNFRPTSKAKPFNVILGEVVRKGTQKKKSVAATVARGLEAVAAAPESNPAALAEEPGKKEAPPK